MISEKGFRVAGTKRHFDRTRAKNTLGQASPTNYTFPGGSGPSSATQQTATINGHNVQIISATTPPKEAGAMVPSNQQIAGSLGAIPSNQLSYVKSVVVSPLRSPNDDYWAKTYNQTGFRSEADAGADGIVHVYPIPSGVSPILDETLIHESGHAYSKIIWPHDADWQPWQNAMKADGRSVSTYADSSKDEDLSESLVMYSLSKGTPCEATARILFPHRYAMLDNLLHPPPPPPKPPTPASPPKTPDSGGSGFLNWLKHLFG